MSHLIKLEQDNHLKFVVNQPDEVLIEFCRIAIDYISNGVNEKKYQIAAKKLETSFETIKSTIEALVCLLIDCTKVHVKQSDLEESLKTLNFTDSQVSILWQFISSKRLLVQNILKLSNVADLRFRDLEWRLEARIASRAIESQAVPIITMKLHLDTETVNAHKETLQAKETEMPITRKEVLLQTDPTNLSHIIQVLEQALIDSKTHRVRNIVNSFTK